jgi:hypothetical protein
MMALAHAAAGAAIAQATDSPAGGAAAAFAAHALLDLPRHEDLTMRDELAVTAGGIVVTARLFGLRSREFWCAFLCACPDLEHLPANSRRKLYPTHRWPVLHELVPTPRVSTRVQLVGSAAALALLARRARTRRLRTA